MVVDRTPPAEPPLGFSWSRKKVRTGLEGLVRPLSPIICSSASMLPETKPSKSRKAKRAEEALGGSGLLALCEVATATPGDASPTSTISVSPRRAPLGGADCVTSPADHKSLGRASPPDLTMVDAAAAAPPKQKTAAFIGVRRRPWGSYAAEIRNHLTGSRE